MNYWLYRVQIYKDRTKKKKSSKIDASYIDNMKQMVIIILVKIIIIKSREIHRKYTIN